MIGNFRERITVQENSPDPIAVATLTRSTATALVTTATPHGYANGDYITIAGATPAGYNGKWKITVTGPTTFSYPCTSTLTTPATGTITATYVSDAQGGQAQGWADLSTIPAELLPVRASERLQAAAMQSQLDLRFRVRTLDSAIVTNKMRIRWTPRWPPSGQRERLLEIHGVRPDGDGRRYQLIDCGERA